MATQRVAVAEGSSLGFGRKDFVEGGLLPDGRYLLTDATVVVWDYDGKVAGAKTTALRLNATEIAVDSKGTITLKGEPRIQYYSAGDPERIGASADGKTFVLISGSGLAKDSNLFIFVDNAIGAGFDEAMAETGDVTHFNNLAVDIVNIPQKVREIRQKSNLVEAGPQQAPRTDRTIPVIKYIGKNANETKWRSGSVPAAATRATAPATTAAAPVAAKAAVAAVETGGDDAASVATTFITQVMGEEASVARTKVRVGVFKAMGAAGLSADVKKAVNELINNYAELEAVLIGVGEGCTLDGDNIVKM